MNIKDIVFSKSHLTAPFTMPDRARNRSAQFTRMEKVASVALSILIGAFTAGIGGVIAFYLITAAMKAKKLNNQQPISEIIRPVPKQKRKAVHFGGARARVFDDDKAPAAIGNLSSVVFRSCYA